MHTEATQMGKNMNTRSCYGHPDWHTWDTSVVVGLEWAKKIKKVDGLSTVEGVNIKPTALFIKLAMGYYLSANF